MTTPYPIRRKIEKRFGLAPGVGGVAAVIRSVPWVSQSTNRSKKAYWKNQSEIRKPAMEEHVRSSDFGRRYIQREAAANAIPITAHTYPMCSAASSIAWWCVISFFRKIALLASQSNQNPMAM